MAVKAKDAGFGIDPVEDAIIGDPKNALAVLKSSQNKVLVGR